MEHSTVQIEVSVDNSEFLQKLARIQELASELSRLAMSVGGESFGLVKVNPQESAETTSTTAQKAVS